MIMNRKYSNFIPGRQLNEQELKFITAAERARKSPGGGRIVIAPKKGVDYTRTILEYLNYVYKHVYPSVINQYNGADLCVIADNLKDPAMQYCRRRFRCRYSTPRSLYGCRGGTFNVIWIRTTEWNFYWLRVACEAIHLENAVIIIQLIRPCHQVPDYYRPLEDYLPKVRKRAMSSPPPLPPEFLEAYWEVNGYEDPYLEDILFELSIYERKRWLKAFLW